MKNTKKLLAVLLAVVMIVSIAISATVAYFKDTDKETNVITIGDVTIDLHEDNGLDAADPDYALDEDYLTWLEGQILLPNTGVEKDVYVENVGSNEAYIRVHVAIPADADNGDIASLVWNDETPSTFTVIGPYTAVVNGVNCNVYVATYNDAIPSGETTADCLTEVAMDEFVDCTRNDDNSITYDLNGATYTSPDGKIPVEVFVEAGQVAGVNATNASEALNIMFGTIGSYNPWVKTYTVADATELADAVAKAYPGDTVALSGTWTGTLEIGFAAEGIIIDASDAALTDIDITANAELTNVTFTGITDLSAPGTGYADAAIAINAGAKVTNLMITDSKFIADDAKYPNVLWTAEPTATIYFTNCEFNGTRAFWTSTHSPAVLSFVKCDFLNIDYWVIQHNATPCNTDITVDQCVFDNCTDGIMKLNSNNNGYISAGHKWTFTNNVLTNCAGHDGSDAKWFAVNTVENGATGVFSNNTLDGVAWTPGTDNGLNIG